MLGLVDVHGWRPGRKAGFLACPLEDIIKQPIDLILKGSSPAERFPTSKCSHVLATSLSDCRGIIKYECISVKFKIAILLHECKCLCCNTLQSYESNQKSPSIYPSAGEKYSLQAPVGCFVCLRRFAGRLPPPMRLDELDYLLPREQIAQRPLDRREASRLLLQDRSSGNFEDRLFAELPSLLRGNELLVS